MPRLPKDYSRHENQIVWKLTFKQLMYLTVVLFGLVLICKLPIHISVKIILIIPHLILGLFISFYKTVDGDDMLIYILKLLSYYGSPKYLVYKKELPINKNEDVNKRKNTKKDVR